MKPRMNTDKHRSVLLKPKILGKDFRSNDKCIGHFLSLRSQRLCGEILWLRLLGWRSVAPCSPRWDDFATLPGLAHLYNRPYMEAHEIGRLVRAAREGDRAAFQAIYEHFVKRIYNFLFRMVGSADE